MATHHHVTPFQFEKFPIRAITRDDGEPWFVLNDVAAALEFDRGRDSARMLDDDEKGAHIVRTPGGDQELTIINESGLYSLIMKSRKPEAKKFKKWVTAEVLPSLRKTGAYVMPGAENSARALPAEVARFLDEAKSQIGGIMKSVVHSEVHKALHDALPALVHGELSRHHITLRRGETAGQVWTRYGLPKMKGGCLMLSHQLVKSRCTIEGGGRAEMGGRTAKLFDPDLVDTTMKQWLLDHCRKHVQGKFGQLSLLIGTKGNNHAH